MFRIWRHLMNEADGGPATGVQPQAGAPAPKPQAQGAAPTIDDATRRSLVEEAKNSLFAELRRTGALKKSVERAIDGNGTQVQQPPGEQDAARPDPTAFRSFDRAMARAGFADKLSDAQYKRVERAFLEERPHDVEAWTKDYFAGFTAAPQQAPTTNGSPTTLNAARSERPASDQGAPGRTETPMQEINLIDGSATASDVDRIVARHGVHGLKDMLTRQLRNARVRVREG